MKPEQHNASTENQEKDDPFITKLLNTSYFKTTVSSLLEKNNMLE